MKSAEKNMQIICSSFRTFRFWSSVFVFLLACQSLRATAQYGDVLAFGNVSWTIMGAPLESIDNEIYKPFSDYINDPKELLAIQRRIYGDSREAPDIKGSTVCWRGYLGKWVIDDGYLYLDNLDIMNIPDSLECYEIAKKFFRRYVHNGRIRADWIKDESFYLQKGPLVSYVHDGYLRGNSRQMIMTIKNGKVQLSRQFGENPIEERMSVAELMQEYLPVALLPLQQFFSVPPGKFKLKISLQDEYYVPKGFGVHYALAQVESSTLDSKAMNKFESAVWSIFVRMPWKIVIIKNGKAYSRQFPSGPLMLLTEEIEEYCLVFQDGEEICFTID